MKGTVTAIYLDEYPDQQLIVAFEELSTRGMGECGFTLDGRSYKEQTKPVLKSLVKKKKSKYAPMRLKIPDGLTEEQFLDQVKASVDSFTIPKEPRPKYRLWINSYTKAFEVQEEGYDMKKIHEFWQPISIEDIF